MQQDYFIFILVIIFIFILFEQKYKNKHNGKSIFQEKKVGDLIQNAVLADGVVRIIEDISLFAI